MQNKTHKINYFFIVIILATFAFLGFMISKEHYTEPKQTGYSTSQYESTKYASATTTRLYLATSTDDTKWIIPISLGVDQLNLNLRMTASSSSGRLDWSYEWSEDRIDWYSEDYASSTLAAVENQYIEHSATTTLKHRWTPGVASEVSKSVVIPNVNANFLRINFERGVVYENLQLWAEVRSRTN
jgi:hypothetical protein